MMAAMSDDEGDNRSPSPDRNVMMSMKSGAQTQGMMKQQMNIEAMEDLMDDPVEY